MDKQLQPPLLAQLACRPIGAILQNDEVLLDLALHEERHCLQGGNGLAGTREHLVHLRQPLRRQGLTGRLEK